MGQALVLTFWLAWSMTPPVDGRSLQRLGAGRPQVGGAREGWRSARFVEDSRRRGLMCVLATAAVLWMVQGPLTAVICAVPVGLGLSWWVGTLEPPSVAREREQISRDLPIAVDLLAACAFVGRPPDSSLALVNRAVGGPLGVRLGAVTARLALGADPLVEWRRVCDDEMLAPLGRTMLRTLESGAPLAEGLTRLAADRRRERNAQVQLRARTVGVKSAGPLAACFLPAFMLIGVVPTVAGAFSHLLL